MMQTHNRKSFRLCLLGLFFIAPLSAIADEAFGYLGCTIWPDKTHSITIQSAPTRYTFSSESKANNVAQGTGSEDATAQAWQQLVEKMNRSREFSRQLVASHGREFMRQVKIKLGYTCLQKNISGHVHDSSDEAHVQREVSTNAWKRFSATQGIEPEFVEITLD